MRDRSIFITGASGYLGRRVVDCIDSRKLAGVLTLDRKQGGDLLAPSTYSEALAGCDTVIHLAAVTGKRKREEYFRVNRDGTRALVEACRRAGVKKFLHVSTIAVNYPGLERYPYAQAKLEAEQIVRESGLSYLIVRPTMIFGREAPVLVNFTRLALAPVIPIFGDGKAKLQPVYVDDVAQWLAAAAEGEFRDEIVELGGPEVLTLEDLLRRIRTARSGKSGPVVHLPMPIVEPAVILAEAVLGPLMPFTAGQLKALTNDGTADVVRGGMRDVSESLRLSFDDGGLREECRTYSKYLTGLEPSEYVVAKYEEFHRSAAAQPTRSGFDRLLVKLSARSVWMTRLADTYASRFFRGSTLRRKLVLLLGLLECAQPSAAYLDAPGSRSIAGAWVGLAMSAARYAASLAASFLLFAPLHLASASRRGR